jgi:hypothetical protein
MHHRVLFAVPALAAAVAACSGQSPQQGAGNEGLTTTATDAINAVQGCSGTADACDADAGEGGSAECRKGMCSCLSRLGPDSDGGHRAFDGGGSVSSADFAAIDACFRDLRTCAAGSTDPKTCAENAISCLEAAIGSADGGGFPIPHPSFDAGAFPHPGFPGADDGGSPGKTPGPVWVFDGGHP